MSTDPQIPDPPEGTVPAPSEIPSVVAPSAGESPTETDAGESRVPFARTAANENLVSTPPTEALPDWEELTPELMEDECVRGDFMIRWAVVLLALLLGFASITETSVLVRVRTGEFLLDNGILPPRTDVLSAAGADRPWVNLHWLTDLLLGAVHRSLGMGALSVLSALATAVSIFLLGRLAYPKVSNWWTSCCAGLALAAVFPVLQPGEPLVTVAGLSLLCAILFRWTETPSSRWVSVGLPMLFVLWPNMDSRAWVGLLLLLGFSVGQFLISRRRPESCPKSAWIGVGGGLLGGILLTPWPGAVFTAWMVQLQEQAELREYRGISEFFGRLNYGLLDPPLWGGGGIPGTSAAVDPFLIVAIGLLVISFVCLALNVKRIHLGWVLVWMIANGLALVFGEMVCYAAVVNAAVASLNGLDWYRTRFSMEYSIQTWPVFQARAGRAVTVLALFGIAYSSVNGMLMDPQGRRLGFGLDPRLRNRLADFEEHILPGVSGDNVFPTLPDVGDICLWLGKRPFIDGRLGLHAGGAENLAKRHRELRLAIFPEATAQNAAADAVAEAADWKAAFKEYAIQDVVSRLWGDAPAYGPLIQLMLNRDWTMTALSGSGANFTRNDLADPAVTSHIETHRAGRFIRRAFRDSVATEKPVGETAPLPLWPAPHSSYDRWTVQRLRVTPRDSALAQHYMQIHNLLQGRLSPQDVAALTTLAIRHARRGIVENPNHPLSYRVLRSAHFSLSQLEQEVAALGGGDAPAEFRMKQVLAASYHAVQAGGRNTDDLVALMQMQRLLQKFDVCRDTLVEILARPDGEAELIEAFGDDFDARDSLDQLEIHVVRVEEGIDEARAGETSRIALAAAVAQSACPATALAILDEDLTQLAGDVAGQLLHASLLNEVGRTQDAWDELESMEQSLPRGAVPRPMTPIMSRWRNETAETNVAAGETTRAVRLWAADQETQMRSGVQGLLQQPFSGGITPMQLDLWPGTEARLAYAALIEVPESWVSLQLKRILVELEAGHVDSARELLEELLKVHPETARRSLVAFYLNMMTDVFHDPSPPSDWIPASDLFAPEGLDETAPPEMKSEPGPGTSPDAGAKGNSPPTGNRPASPALPERI